MWLWIVLVVLAVMAAARAKVMAKACYSEYEKFDVAKMEVISDE